MGSLAGKVAIVTGAGRGIGRAIALRLAADGACVVVNYAHSADEASEVVAAIQTQGGEALAVQADMSKVSDICRLFEQTIDRFGHLNILVNNSGIGAFVPLTEITEEQFDTTFALNAKGTLFAMQQAGLHMTDGGRIVNISSASTVLSLAGMTVYAGSKGAVEFAPIAAKELGGRGITVNTVMPGATSTESFHEMNTAESEASLAQMSPLGRLGEPEDIADVVAFVVSDSPGWLTGQNIRATGGLA